MILTRSDWLDTTRLPTRCCAARSNRRPHRPVRRSQVFFHEFRDSRDGRHATAQLCRLLCSVFAIGFCGTKRTCTSRSTLHHRTGGTKKLLRLTSDRPGNTSRSQPSGASRLGTTIHRILPRMGLGPSFTFIAEDKSLPGDNRRVLAELYADDVGLGGV
jgi:hypothetical protein